MSSWISKLKEAKELFDGELITEAQFNRLRDEAFALREATEPEEPDVHRPSIRLMMNSVPTYWQAGRSLSQNPKWMIWQVTHWQVEPSLYLISI